MDVRKLLDTIKKGVEFVEGLKPAIEMIPAAGPILATAVSAASAVTEVITNIKERVDEGKLVLASSDADEIKGYVDRLAAVNDELAAFIDQS